MGDLGVGAIIWVRQLFSIFPSKGGDYSREAIDRGMAIIRGNTFLPWSLTSSYHWYYKKIPDQTVITNRSITVIPTTKTGLSKAKIVIVFMDLALRTQ